MGENKRKQGFFELKCIDILSILCAAAVPIALGIYTAITYEQGQQQQQKTEERQFNQNIQLRQDNLYNNFLKNVFKLDIDGYLDDGKSPWAFANAYYRAAHRHLEPVRKGDIFQFLKENRLIGRDDCTDGCRKEVKEDIIRLDELSFKNMHFSSQTGTLTKLNLDCIAFNRVLMDNTTFLYANLNGASFNSTRLKNVNFHKSSLECADFYETDLDGVDFTDTSLKGVKFINVDMSKVKLTDEQWKQVTIINKSISNTITSTTKTSGTTKLTTIASSTKTATRNTTIRVSVTTTSVSTTITTVSVTNTSVSATITTVSDTTTSVSTTITTVSDTTTSVSTTITTVSDTTTSVSATITGTHYCTEQLITFEDIPNATNTTGPVPNLYKSLIWTNVEYVYVPTTKSDSFYRKFFNETSYVIRTPYGSSMEISTNDGAFFSLIKFRLGSSCSIPHHIKVTGNRSSSTLDGSISFPGAGAFIDGIDSTNVNVSLINFETYIDAAYAQYAGNCAETEIILDDICVKFYR